LSKKNQKKFLNYKALVFFIILTVFSGVIVMGDNKVPSVQNGSLNEKSYTFPKISAQSVSPVELGQYYDDYNYTMDVFVDGDIAYLADFKDGLEIINVSDPYHPTEIANFNDGGAYWEIAMQGDLAYITDRYGGLRIFDISDPTKPKKLCNFNEGDESAGISVSGNIAYLSVRSNGTKIIDVSDPYNPYTLGVYNDGGISTTTFISRDLLYVADGADGLEIIDINYQRGQWLTPSLLGK